jgi:hypothetical protein
MKTTYVIRKFKDYWLLEREDKGVQLAYFTSRERALASANVLAQSILPSCVVLEEDDVRRETNFSLSVNRRVSRPHSELQLSAH